MANGFAHYPSRETLAALVQAANAVRQSAILGIVRPLDESRLQVLYASALGVGAYTLPSDQVPIPLQPATRGIARIDAIASDPERPIEWQAAFAGARQLLSLPTAADSPASRVWIGLPDEHPPTPVEVGRLQDVVAGAARLLAIPSSDGQGQLRLQRLELAAGLLPALMQVLDIREVFDPLSEISKQALPHDLLMLGLFSDDLTRVTLHARAGAEPAVGGTFPQPYPPAVARAWEFDIVDDRFDHPLERDRHTTQLGGRSSVRVPLRLGDHLIGVLGFMSFEPHRYATADVEIARRLADYVTVALAHQRLAEQARHNDELRARAGNLALLDDLLTSLIDTGDLRLAFERISNSVQKILPHDAATLPIVLPDGRHARMYASIGVEPPWPEIVDIPPELVQNPEWEDEIVEDLPSHPDPRNLGSIQSGFMSLMRVPVRQEGRFAGTVMFLSRKLSAFSPPDLLVARRIADRLALLVARDREIEASKRADEASARTMNLERLDELLAALIDSGPLPDVFDRLSGIAAQVLPHDGVVMMVRLPDGLHGRLYASAGFSSPLPEIQEIPPEVLRTPDWDHYIIDDIALETDPRYARLVNMGFNSLLRMSIRLDAEFAGSLTFVSKARSAFKQPDVLIGRRVADRLAVTLARDREVAASRRADEASARAMNLERLDELLAALIDSGELPDVFGRLSEIAAQVLQHEAVALMVRQPDGKNARVYASSGFPGALPETMEIPPELLDNSKWEADIFDTLPVDGSRFALAVKLGFRSALRVRVRLEGQFAGALVFFSVSPGQFTAADVLPASRIADRLAVTLTRDREVAASRRADEAAARAAALESRVKELTEELDARTGYRRVVGESPEWRKVLTQATQVAPNETTVLLLGESGTGKEVVARFVHRASPRTRGPFIALNCAALPEQLLEAELFGYERGAYTGAVQSKPGQLEHAAGGTLFLDEVGEMSLPAQAKFLRVLQEREFQRLGGTRVLKTDARIIAATNRDLERAITQNLFREDLYYRLNVFAIYLPALRDRPADILPLSEAFLAEIGRSIARPAAGISRDARERLLDYHWPGNVRELRNILERASILCDGGLITPDHLAIGVGARPSSLSRAAVPTRAVAAAAPGRSTAGVTSAGELKSLERDMIEQALQRVRFNKSKAAKDLGLTRQQLYLRMKKYGLE